jgi:septal ring factor EnvC (AmiA/AmiB activator)
LRKVINEVVYATKNNELEEEIKQLQQQIDDVQEAIANSNSTNDIEYLEGLLKHLDYLESKPVDEQNRILKQVFDKIEYIREDDEIIMYYHFKE